MSNRSLHSVFSKPHLATGLSLDDLQMALDEAAEAGAHFCETPGRRHAAKSWLQRNGFSPQVVELLDSMLEIRKNSGCEPFFVLDFQTTSFGNEVWDKRFPLTAQGLAHYSRETFKDVFAPICFAMMKRITLFGGPEAAVRIGCQRFAMIKRSCMIFAYREGLRINSLRLQRMESWIRYWVGLRYHLAMNGGDPKPLAFTSWSRKGEETRTSIGVMR